MTTEQIIPAAIGFIVVTAILTLISQRQKQSAWKGEIINKNHIEPDEDGPEKYQVICKSESGKKNYVDVFQKDFETFQIGDKVEKKKGEYFISKI
jgi:hypothetical protein